LQTTHNSVVGKFKQPCDNMTQMLIVGGVTPSGHSWFDLLPLTAMPGSIPSDGLVAFGVNAPVHASKVAATMTGWW
jgi:hypothetical protein